MRFRLRTLLILIAIVPPFVGGAYAAYRWVKHFKEQMELAILEEMARSLNEERQQMIDEYHKNLPDPTDGAFHDPLFVSTGAITLELSVANGDPLRRFENVRCRYRCKGSGSYSTVAMRKRADSAVSNRILCECSIPNDFHCSNGTTSYYFEFSLDGMEKRYPPDLKEVFSLALPEAQTTQSSP